MTKNVLILGATGGIGEAIVKSFRDEDCHMILQGRNVAKLNEYKALTPSCSTVCGDITSEKTLQEIFSLAEMLNGIDIVVNSCGEYFWESIENTTFETIDKIFDVNLIAPFKLISKLTADMKRKKYGRIINIGSISGVVGEANASLYSASKAGLTGLTKALALELAEFGITVNLINPGWVKTPLTDEHFDGNEKEIQEELDAIPQHRFIAPVEIAEAVKYLVSDSAKGLTGQNLNLCAGLSLG